MQAAGNQEVTPALPVASDDTGPISLLGEATVGVKGHAFPWGGGPRPLCSLMGVGVGHTQR